MILALIFILTRAAAAGTAAVPQADPVCARAHLDQPDFQETKALKGGARLHICGSRVDPGAFTEGSLFLEKSDGTVTEQRIELGGLNEAFGPFDAQLVRVHFLPDGLEVTELIPVHEGGASVPAFRRLVHCREACQEDKAPTCVFKKIQEARDPAATSTVTNALEPKGRLPTDAELMDAYRNALGGDRAALRALLDPRLKRKLDQSLADEPHAGCFAHECIAGVLGKLRRAHCL